MLDFFDYIISFLENIGNYFNNVISTLISNFSLVINIQGFISKTLGFVPPIIASCITLVTAIAIAKLIVGWGNQ